MSKFYRTQNWFLSTDTYSTRKASKLVEETSGVSLLISNASGHLNFDSATKMDEYSNKFAVTLCGYKDSEDVELINPYLDI